MVSATTSPPFQVSRLTTNIGATVSGIDLSQPQTDETMRAIEAALHEHAVLFFLGQNLDDVSHWRFGQWFGELDIHHSGRNLNDRPEIYVLENYGQEIQWHADITFLEKPARASVLRPVVLPEVGGDTVWTSTCMAYDTLSAPLQQMVDGLTAYHDCAALLRRDPHLQLIGAVHPVVIDHPVTGRRSLFVNPMFTQRIVELSRSESAAVLDLLYRHIQAASHQVRWKWRRDAVVMWDNFASQHCVVYDYNETRSMRRVTIKGSRPASSLVNLPVSSGAE